MLPQVALLVKVELQKLLDVGFIRPIDYLEWIFNLVPISKPNNNIIISIDLKILTRLVPKMIFHWQTLI